MKVCDRHNDKPAVDTIHFSRDDTYVDVCDECKYAIGEVLSCAPLEIQFSFPNGISDCCTDPATVIVTEKGRPRSASRFESLSNPARRP